ncbi:MAG: hypothetical protein PHU93_03615 [Candidatus Gracilibacteria bacterium]|nr:hypothetical protein [Candidatus Gracilibacteria bacterium]
MLQTNKIKSLPHQLEISHSIGIASKPNWQLMFQAQNASKDKQPEGIDGYFLIPHWSEIASSYGGATALLVDHIGQRRKFRVTQNLSVLFESFFLTETERKATAIASIQKEQGSKFSIIPAQLGAKYLEQSAHEAVVSMRKHEFPLGLYEVCYIVLQHTELLEGTIFIECPGDSISPDGNGIFSHVPVFVFHEKEIHFAASLPEDVHSTSGIASAIFGQCKM